MALPSKSPLTPGAAGGPGHSVGNRAHSQGELSEGWLWLLLCNECPPHKEAVTS